MKDVLIMIVETQFGVQQEVYPGTAKLEEKGNCIRILDGGATDKSILGIYPTARVVGGRFFSRAELMQMAAAKGPQGEPVPEGLNTEAPTEEPTNAEAVHPSSGAEGQ